MRAVLRVLLTSLRGHWGWGLLILGALLVETAYNAGVSWSFKILVDQALIPRNSRVLWLVLGLLASGGVLVFCVGLGRDQLYARLSTASANDLRERLFGHLQRMSLDFHARMSPADVIARFSTDIASVEHALAVAASTALLPALEVLASAVLLFALEWRLALVAMLIFPLALVGPRLLEGRAVAASYVRKQHESRVLGIVQETLGAPALVKAFGLERQQLALFMRQLGELGRSGVRVGFLGALLERSAASALLVVHVLVTGLGAYMAFSGVLSIGAFMSFQALFFTMSWTLALCMQFVPPLVQATGGMQRIAEVLAEPPGDVDRAEATPLPPLAREIAFDDVTFAYEPSGRGGLRGVSFTIAAGERVALVGPSGAGKSTVLGLLACFHDPQSGRVTVDGRDLRQATHASWRSQIGLVSQDSFLFDTTIAENIRLGRLEATAASVEHAAGLAELHPVIAGLPEGYDTVVGERGGRLSGGQRQRVALARALVRDPALLLLDEVTAALDPQTEAAINATLERVWRGRTVVTVTHRLASVVRADRILVLDGGRLVEQGRHEALLARGGVYARLWEKQSGFVVSADGTRASVEAARLRRVPMFATMMDASLHELAVRFAVERFPAGGTIVVAGDVADRFYLIVRGEVEVIGSDPDGEAREIAVLQDGDHFGEIALLHDMRRTATVRARTPCLCLSLPRDQFRTLVETTPDLERALMEMADARLEQGRMGTRVAADDPVRPTSEDERP